MSAMNNDFVLNVQFTKVIGCVGSSLVGSRGFVPPSVNNHCNLQFIVRICISASAIGSFATENLFCITSQFDQSELYK